MKSGDNLFFKRKDVFFETLMQSAANLKEAATLFQEQMNNLEMSSNYAENIKLLEDKGDELSHKVIKALEKTFITPIEREDILGLAIKIDDVVDGIEACSDRLDLYNITEPDDYLKLFAQMIVNSADEIVAAMALLEQKKLKEIQRHVHRINQLENEADQLLREGLLVLFAEIKDPILLMKKKEIYEFMEKITDSCEDVANILEALLMRNT